MDDKYPIRGKPTTFQEIYDRFFGKITDDMYVEWTKEDTEADLLNILLDAIPGFEFPRFPLYDYGEVYVGEEDENEGVQEPDNSEVTYLTVDADDIINLDEPKKEKRWQFNCHLTSEEINILALLMYNTWLQRQIASIENIRMKYSGVDYKLSSQANHLAKLIELKKEAERQTHHMQRLYKRRKIINEQGSIKSNWSTLAETSALDGQIQY